MMGGGRVGYGKEMEAAAGQGGRWMMGDISKKSALLHKLQTHVDGWIVITTTAGYLPLISHISSPFAL